MDNGLFKAGGACSGDKTTAYAPPPETLEQMLRHPRLYEAMRRVAGGLVDLYSGNRVLNALCNDRAQTQMGFIALYLHWSRRSGQDYTGLTIGRLKTHCRETNLCSPGRVEAMMALMRAFGFVKDVRDPYDHRVKFIVPTEKLIVGQSQRLRQQFEGLAVVMPEGAAALAALERPEFVRAFVRLLCEKYLSGLRVLHQVPELATYTERNGGLLMVLNILNKSQFDQHVPSPLLAKISSSAMSRRFDVSRAHVRKLLKDLETDGYVRRVPENASEIQLMPKLVEAVARFFAALFLVYASCARDALQEIDASPAVADR